MLDESTIFDGRSRRRTDLGPDTQLIVLYHIICHSLTFAKTFTVRRLKNGIPGSPSPPENDTSREAIMWIHDYNMKGLKEGIRFFVHAKGPERQDDSCNTQIHVGDLASGRPCEESAAPI